METSQADEQPTTHTSVEVDRDLWRQMREQAELEGRTVGEQLEAILRDQFGDQQ